MRVYPKMRAIPCCDATHNRYSTTMNHTATLASRAFDPSSQPATRPENARGLAALLLAASVAALAVVADQLVETWIDDHLFLAWVAMWAVVFAGSLLLTGTVRRMSARTLAKLDQWAAGRAQARAAARLQAQQAVARTSASPAGSLQLAKAARALDSHLFYL